MSTIEPVKKEIVVQASQEHAFKVFTGSIDKWWPRKHHIGKSPLKRAVLEERLGGRWYSVCEDGTEVDIGKVLVWDPPRALVLSWQIDGEWKFDPNFLTEVEVFFTAIGPKETRVALAHTKLEAYAAKEDEIRKAIGSPGGWPHILEEFARIAHT